MRQLKMFGLALLMVAPAVVFAQNIVVMVNGERVMFDNMQPIERGGRVLVPLRGVFEKLGASVGYEAASQKVTVRKGDDIIELTVGDSSALKNQQTIPMSAKAIVRKGSTMVPLRFLAESLDANVQWDGAKRTVRISTSANVPPPPSGNPPPPETGGTGGSTGSTGGR